MILRIITIGYLHVNDFIARVLEDVLMLAILGLKLYEFKIFEEIRSSSGLIDTGLMYRWNQIGWITAYLEAICILVSVANIVCSWIYRLTQALLEKFLKKPKNNPPPEFAQMDPVEIYYEVMKSMPHYPEEECLPMAL
jgi:hypothetical protein